MSQTHIPAFPTVSFLPSRIDAGSITEGSKRTINAIINPATTATNIIAGMLVRIVPPVTGSETDISLIDVITAKAQNGIGIVSSQYSNASYVKGAPCGIVPLAPDIKVAVVAGGVVAMGASVYYDFSTGKFVSATSANTTDEPYGIASTASTATDQIIQIVPIKKVL